MGGGFGGLYTALELSSNNNDLQISLIDPSDSFCFLPLLYDLVSGTASAVEVQPTYASLLRNQPNIRHIAARVTQICPLQNQLVLDDEDNNDNSDNSNNILHFDAAILSVGAQPRAVPDGVQPFYTAQHAQQTQELLKATTAKSNNKRNSKQQQIAVVGGGFGGVELATSLMATTSNHNNNQNVTLIARSTPSIITDQIQLPKNLPILLGTVTNVTRNGQRLHLLPASSSNNDNETSSSYYDFDTIFWTIGTTVAEPLASGDIEGLEQDATTNRVCVNQYLQSTSRDNIWALGDCARSTSNLPQTAQVALQQAPVVANNVASFLYGKTPKQAFVYQDLGRMMTLGGADAGFLGTTLLGPLLEVTDLALEPLNDLLSQTLLLQPNQNNQNQARARKGAWTGALAGTARRLVYAARMPNAQQSAISALSAWACTTQTLLQRRKSNSENNNSKQ